jgi:hypothetical protein
LTSDTRVWYAAYGSNLNRERLMAYLQGGPIPGGAGSQTGCRDPEPPRRESALWTPRGRLFCGWSERWQGAVAFLGPPDGAGVWLRLYDVSWEQFQDITAQENGLAAGEWSLDPARLAAGEDLPNAAPGWYDTVVHLGDHRGQPALCFTTSQPSILESPGEPSEAYMRHILGWSPHV